MRDSFWKVFSILLTPVAVLAFIVVLLFSVVFAVAQPVTRVPPPEGTSPMRFAKAPDPTTDAADKSGTTRPFTVPVYCHATENIVRDLSNPDGKWKENPVAYGNSNGGIVWVMANEKTRSFTIVFQRADGVQCVIAAGTGAEVQGFTSDS